MNHLKTLGISLIVSICALFAFYSYFPLDNGIINLRGNNNGLVGSTITTINGSDTLKNSRTTINDNFASLNATKAENSATTFSSLVTLSGLTTASNLAVVGTITSGIWHGSLLDVSYGGTGSSSLASKQILFGNGTSPLQSIGFGNAGEFLTSSGTNALPYWQSSSVNQASNYTWTGAHTFNATTTISTSTIRSLTTTGPATLATTTISNVDFTDNLLYTISSSSPVTVSDSSYGSASVTCSAGYKVISGGFVTSDSSATYVRTHDSYPSSDTVWTVRVYKGGSGGTLTITAYAICIKL